MAIYDDDNNFIPHFTRAVCVDKDGKGFVFWQEHTQSGVPIYLDLNTKEPIVLPDPCEIVVLDPAKRVAPDRDAKQAEHVVHERRVAARKAKAERDALDAAEAERVAKLTALEREAEALLRDAELAEREAKARAAIDDAKARIAHARPEG